MPALQFTRDLADAIRAGRKSQTLRAKLPGNCRVGNRLTLQNGYNRGSNLVGHAVIASVDQVRSIDLTLDDARLDGFATLADLHTRLVAMRAPDVLWRVRWRDFSPAPEAARPVDVPSSGRHTRTPHTVGRRRRANRALGSSPR